MNVQEAIAVVVQLKECINGTLSAEQKREIILLYREVLGREIKECNCRDRYSDALIEVYCYLKRNGKMKEKCNYILKSGVVVHVSGSSVVYTNDNLTDEVAAIYLEKYPKAADLFEHIPPISEVEKTVLEENEVGNSPAETEAINTEDIGEVNHIEVIKETSEDIGEVNHIEVIKETSEDIGEVKRSKRGRKKIVSDN